MAHSMKPHAATDGRDHDDALVVYANKGKTILTILLLVTVTAAVVTIPGVLGPTDRGSFYGNPTLDVLAQIVGGVLGGGATIRLLTVLFSRAPRVVVSYEGIWVSSLVFGSAIIPWAEIGCLYVVGRRWLKQSTLFIVLRDWQALRHRQTRLEGLLWQLGGFALVSPHAVTVADNLLPMSNAELVGRIHARFEHELVAHHIQVRVA